MVLLERMTRGRLHYGWIVAAVTFVTLLAAAGIRPTPGVLMVPLDQEFGWSRASISLAVSVNLVLYGFLGPFSAAFVHPLVARTTMRVALTPLGVPAGTPPVPVGKGNPLTAAFEALGEGVRSRGFWLLAGSFFICGLSTNGLIGTHLIPSCIDHGIPGIMAAGLLAMMGVFDFIRPTASRWLSDRWNNPHLLCWYYGRRGISLLFLPLALENPTFGLPAFAVFYGLDWIATVPPTVRLAADIFGKENAGMMFGWIVASHQG